ncbi:hypothetical protein [Streptomyces sp. NBC_01500]|uniref:hypothetical protein n=1 Tax=Streptomyces sp. NBC_01500 TaxID=2903886 RepID=UPI0022501C74|nr:hypothetical protein [Streptomyces sp. NBC_01500]MCX4554156.1 hypothetical protein [Streptomyces sp. NBC_01500]
MRMYDSPLTSIYRVTVNGYDYRTHKAFIARINVKASSPKAAREWVISYPHYAGLPRYTSLEVMTQYKLKKSGTNTARFDCVFLAEWKAQVNH